MLSGLFNYDNPVWRFIGKFWDVLIVNLPGSRKAVQESLEYILPHLEHGIQILMGDTSECGRK